MERVIDRTAYRRNDTCVKAIQKENIKYIEKKIKKILYQLLISSMLFLSLAIAKLYRVENVLTWVDVNMNEELNLKEMYEFGQNKIVQMTQYIKNIEQLKLQKNMEVEEMDEENLLPLKNEEVKELMNSEAKYEEAVEGINQLIEDAEYIKEKYNLRHPINGTVTSVFGVRESDNKIVTPYHSGIDVAANKGTNIYAAIGGEVVTASTDNAYGKYIMIETDEIVTVYAHCNELKVKKGQKVKQGELIGKVGSTGWATGPHLHFEIRLKGRLVNPADVLDYSNMGEQ